MTSEAAPSSGTGTSACRGSASTRRSCRGWRVTRARLWARKWTSSISSMSAWLTASKTPSIERPAARRCFNRRKSMSASIAGVRAAPEASWNSEVSAAPSGVNSSASARPEVSIRTPSAPKCAATWNWPNRRRTTSNRVFHGCRISIRSSIRTWKPTAGTTTVTQRHSATIIPCWPSHRCTPPSPAATTPIFIRSGWPKKMVSPLPPSQPPPRPPRPPLTPPPTPPHGSKSPLQEAFTWIGCLRLSVTCPITSSCAPVACTWSFSQVSRPIHPSFLTTVYPPSALISICLSDVLIGFTPLSLSLSLSLSLFFLLITSISHADNRCWLLRFRRLIVVSATWSIGSAERIPIRNPPLNHYCLNWIDWPVSGTWIIRLDNLPDCYHVFHSIRIPHLDPKAQSHRCRVDGRDGTG